MSIVTSKKTYEETGTCPICYNTATMRDEIKQLQSQLTAANEEIAFWMGEGDGTEWPPENIEWRKLFDIPSRTPEQTKEMVRLATVIRWKGDEKIQYERAELAESQVAAEKDAVKELVAMLAAAEEALRWRPVGEPPKNEDQVSICYAKTGYTYNAYYDLRYKTWNIFNYAGGFVVAEDDPSHWRPIDLPKKDEENKP